MATVQERMGARRADGLRVTREYWVRGVTTELDARAAMIGFVPPEIVDGQKKYVLKLEACGAEEVETRGDGTNVADGVWLCGATWENSSKRRLAGTFTLSFDISGQATRIYQSRETKLKQAAPGKTAPDFKGAIGYQEDDTIEGVDILVPYFTYTINVTLSNAVIQSGWVLNAAEVVGSVNSSPYYDFDEGELLLYRVTGQQRQDDKGAAADWDVSLSFAVSRNEEDLDVGDITGISKQGWDYLWVYYETKLDDDTHRTHRVPLAAYVEEVYRRTDYGLLDT